MSCAEKYAIIKLTRAYERRLPIKKDTDIIEFDFPDYEEPYPPFPDVKTAPVDMDEAYLRNAELAKRLSSDIDEPTEKAKTVPRKKKAAKPLVASDIF
mgnify:CR=1 FL=1